jgi:hypothetical protein
VKTIQIKRGGIRAAVVPASFAKIPTAIKIPTLFFYLPIVRFSPEEENRQLRKLN